MDAAAAVETTPGDGFVPSSAYERERGKPVPSYNHGLVQANLTIELAKNREYRVLSELDVEFAGKKYTPDLCLYRREPADFRHDEIRVKAAPLLIVEISSPTQGDYPLIKKIDAYFAAGVRSCWLVHLPVRTVAVLLPDGSQRVFHDEETVVDPVTGVTAELRAVFS